MMCIFVLIIYYYADLCLDYDYEYYLKVSVCVFDRSNEDIMLPI